MDPACRPPPTRAGHPACGLDHVSAGDVSPAPGPDTVASMSVESAVMVGLMTFVLLAPTLMVAVLVSGLSRRGAAASRRSAASDETGPDLGRLLVADGIVVPVEVDEHRAVGELEHDLARLERPSPRRGSGRSRPRSGPARSPARTAPRPPRRSPAAAGDGGRRDAIRSAQEQAGRRRAGSSRAGTCSSPDRRPGTPTGRPAAPGRRSRRPDRSSYVVASTSACQVPWSGSTDSGNWKLSRCWPPTSGARGPSRARPRRCARPAVGPRAVQQRQVDEHRRQHEDEQIPGPSLHRVAPIGPVSRLLDGGGQPHQVVEVACPCGCARASPRG